MATLYKLPTVEALRGLGYTIPPDVAVTGVKAEVVEVQPRNGTNFRLPELYEMLDTQIVEVVGLRDGRILICDEEGKCRGAWLVNQPATDLYRALGGDYIAGSALLCQDGEFR